MTEGDILTIEEVAKYLRVSERTVYDWAQKHEIPAGKLGTVWRFKRGEIERWVDEKLSHKTFIPQAGNIHLETIISTDRIIFLNCASKRDAITELARNLSLAPQVKDGQELVTEILKREDLMSTAIGKGVAIPHVRLASVTDLVVSVGISRVEITDFQPLDNEPVRLLFMIAACYNQHAYYLQNLSFFSARLKNSALRDALINAQSAEKAYRLLIDAEER
jgi:PTS system nitrogen regulatory IIA component